MTCRQTIVRHLLLAVVVALVTSCASVDSDESPYEPLAMDALHNFVKMHQAGKLPGFARNERGSVMTGAVPDDKEVAYPVTIVIHVTPKTQKSRYAYTFVKDNAPTPWRLASALRILKDGQQEELRLE